MINMDSKTPYKLVANTPDLTDKQLELANAVLGKIQTEDKTALSAAMMGCDPASIRGASFVESSVYYYKAGLRGRRLRSQLRSDYGISILLVLQLILVVAQIIYWIRELLKDPNFQDAI